jgi:hypothetical protein
LVVEGKPVDHSLLQLQSLVAVALTFLQAVLTIAVSRMNNLLQLWFALLVGAASAAWAEEFDSDGVKIRYLVEGRGEHLLSQILVEFCVRPVWSALRRGNDECCC